MGPKLHMIVESGFGLHKNENFQEVYILIHSQIIVYQMKIIDFEKKTMETVNILIIFNLST